MVYVEGMNQKLILIHNFKGRVECQKKQRRRKLKSVQVRDR